MEGDVRNWYCVGESDRKHLTANALLQVGPGSKCDHEKPSLNARIEKSDSRRFELCLRVDGCEPRVFPPIVVHEMIPGAFPTGQ